MEDYIEQIYMLIEDKGYARVSDIADALAVHPSSNEDGSKARQR